MWNAIVMSIPMLGPFFGAFIFVFSGFALWGHVTFGSEVRRLPHMMWAGVECVVDCAALAGLRMCVADMCGADMCFGYVMF